MSREKHIMLDIECLSVRQDAIVTNIGYTVFFPKSREIVDSGNIYLDIVEQGKLGRTVMSSTLDFWVNQSKEAQHQITSTNRLSVNEALNLFNSKCEGISKAWAKSTNFDMEILKSLYEAANIKWPIKYSKYVDVRSMYWLAKQYNIKLDKQSNKHDAEQDAIYQTKVLFSVLYHIENNEDIK